MPNWCTNTIKMQGIAKMPEYFTDGDFDFNKVIPMPESLNVEAGTQTDWGIIAYLTNGLKTPFSELEEEEQTLAQKYVANEFAKDKPVRVEKQLRDLVKIGQIDINELVKKGKVYVLNCLRYEAPTWYEWCNRNWNTKWNACDTRIVDDDTICFDTAWAVPIPVLLKISKARQTEISGDFWIEGGTEGEYKLANGKIVHFERRPIRYGVEED